MYRSMAMLGDGDYISDVSVDDGNEGVLALAYPRRGLPARHVTL